MSVKHAYAGLPKTYAAALRLRTRGLNEQEIATELELEADAVPTLLRIAEAKLAALSAKKASLDPGKEGSCRTP